MQPQPHRSGRRWRRFFRQNRGALVFGFLALLIVALVGVLFWVISSPQFVRPRG